MTLPGISIATPTDVRVAGVKDYVAMMRLDHATKHVFIVPGIVLALLLRGHFVRIAPGPFLAGLIVAVTTASANYVINEYLDRSFDAHHPTKSARTAVRMEMSGIVIGLQWAWLVTISLTVAASASKLMLITDVLFATQGIVYNVTPLRLKNLAHLDVLSESVNNPLRLLIGWAMVDPSTLPPSSVILAYWLGGAFLMAAKRLSEYREIVTAHGIDLLKRYRRSFAGYTERSLMASCLVYATLSSMALAIFFLKYRLEYIIILPAVSLLFGQYLTMSMHSGSTAQRPERLFSERNLMYLVASIAILFVIFTFVDIPEIGPLISQSYIRLQ
jgi:4-hydroxybenzoate polyprenyltransferase